MSKLNTELFLQYNSEQNPARKKIIKDKIFMNNYQKCIDVCYHKFFKFSLHEHKEDFYQEASLVLYENIIDAYDINNKDYAEFVSFAVAGLRSILFGSNINDLNNIVKIKTGFYHSRIKRVKDIIDIYYKNNINLGLEELSYLTDINKNNLQTIFYKLTNKDYQEENDNKFYDREFYDKNFDYKDNKQVQDIMIDKINKSFNILTEREREIIDYRYNKDYNLNELAEIYNVTKQYIHIVEKQALNKIKKHIGVIDE